MTCTCIGGNPGPALRQVQQWVWVKSLNWIPTLPLFDNRSPTSILIKTNILMHVLICN